MKKLGIVLVSLLVIVSQLWLTATPAAATPNFNDGAFSTTWNRVDRPVEALSDLGRGYVWGPQVPNSDAVTTESYNNVSRKVQYFDKARMEINSFTANPGDLFYVTTGLLVKELVTGLRQDGDYIFTPLQPSTVQVAGDPNDGSNNAVAPTYASFRNVATVFNDENSQPDLTGTVITNTIDKAGTVSQITPPEQRAFKAYNQTTHHNIADVFVDYGNITGQVWDGSKFVNDSVMFGNPTYVLGLPITEPYWTRAVVNGTEKDVLVQLFERRVLTYTPSNADPNKVEMGNVGQHYYKWRYQLNSGIPQSTASSITPTAGTPQTAPISVTFGINLQVAVRDPNGVPMAGQPVTFQTLATGPSGIFPNAATSASVTTDASGIATAPVFTANNTAGDYVVTASTPNVPGQAVFSLTNLAGTPASMAIIAGNPQSIKAKTLAGTHLQVQIRDAYSNPVSGVTVTYLAPSSGISGVWATGSSPITTTVTTDSSGIGTAPDFTANCSLGTYGVTVVTSGMPNPVQFQLTNIAGDPGQVSVAAGNNQQAAVTAAFASTLQAQVSDVCGNALPNVAVNFTSPTSAASAVFTGTNNTFQAVSGSNGIATSVALQANTIAGSYTVVANVNKVSSKANFNLTNTAGAATSISTASGSSQITGVNTSFGANLRALVVDVYGNPVPNVPVTFSPPSTTGASLIMGGTPSVNTGSDGIATSGSLTANCTTGTYAVQAAIANSTTAAATSFVLTNNTGIATNITATLGSGQSATVNTNFTTPLTAQVTDSCGNSVSDTSVVFLSPDNSAGVKFASAYNVETVTTNSNGVATSSTMLANTFSGSYVAQASLPLSPQIATYQLNNAHGTAASLSIVKGNQQQTVISTPFNTALQVQVKDNFGNLVPGTTVTFQAPSTGPGGTFASGASSITAQSDEKGLATSSAFTANSTAGSYSVTASAPNAGIQNFSLSNMSGIPASILVQAGSDQSAMIDTVFPSPLKAIVRDSGNNPLAGVQVTFQAPANGTSGVPGGLFADGSNNAVASTNAAGVATSPSFKANLVAGNYNVSAAATTLNTTASFHLINTPSGVASIQAVQGSDQSTGVNVAFATPLIVLVRDAENNAVPNTVVTFTAPDPSSSSVFFSNSANSVTVATAADGTATISNFKANCVVSNGGSYTVIASVSGIGTANFDLTNLPGAPAALSIIGGSGQTAKISHQLDPLQARLTDACNNVLPQVPVTFAAPTSGASAILAGNTNNLTLQTDANGLVNTGVITTNTVPGSYNVTASVGTGSQLAPASFNLTNLPGDPTQIATSNGTPQTGVVGTTFANPLQVTVRDAGNNPVSGVVVTFASPTNPNAPGGTDNAGGQATTDGNGTASVAYTANTHIGVYNVIASITGASTQFQLTNKADAVAVVRVSASSVQTTTVNTSFTNPLVFTAQDQYGNPVAGTALTFSAPTSGASGIFMNNTVLQTDAQGQVQMTFRANSQVGSYNVVATAGNSVSGSVNLTNIAGAPSSIAATGSTLVYSTTIGTVFASPLQVLVKDVSGNPVPNATVTFTGPAPNQPQPAAFMQSNPTASSVVVQTDANGLANIQVQANWVAGSYIVAATVTGVSTPVNFQLTNKPGAPATVEVRAGSPQSTPINTTFTTTLQARVLDAYNNPVPGVLVSFQPAQSAQGATATFANTASVTTDATGVASATALTANSLIGSYHVYAVVVNLAVQGDFQLTNSSGPPVSITALNTAAQTAPVSTTFGTVLQMKVVDAGNNPVPNITVVPTVPSSGASVSLAPLSGQTATDVNGIIGYTAKANCSIGGPYQVSFTVAGVAQPAIFQFTNQLGSPASVSPLSAALGSAKVLNNFSGQLIAFVSDVCNNPVQGVPVTFTSSKTAGVDNASFASSNVATSGPTGQAIIQPVAGCPLTSNYAVTPSISGGTTAGNFSLTNLVGDPAAITAVSPTAPQSLTVGGSLTLKAKVTDACGNPEPSVQVTFSAAAGGSPGLSYPSGNAVNTDAAGIATIAATANCTSGGPYIVSAQFANQPATIAPVQYQITNNALANPYTLQAIGPTSPIYKGNGPPIWAFPSSYYVTPGDLQVQVVGCGGTLVPNQQITWAIENTPANSFYLYGYRWASSGDNVTTGPTLSDVSGLAIPPNTPTSNGAPNDKASFWMLPGYFGNNSGTSYTIRATVNSQGNSGSVVFTLTLP